DAAYQQFRAMVRDPRWQAQFLAKSIPERLAMAQQARGESQAANQMKSAEIMDVNPQAVEDAFRASGVDVMVHGHTHRPGRHVLMVDGRRRERWVLPDWDGDHAEPPGGSWLVIDRDGPVVYDRVRAGPNGRRTRRPARRPARQVICSAHRLPQRFPGRCDTRQSPCRCGWPRTAARPALPP